MERIIYAVDPGTHAVGVAQAVVSKGGFGICWTKRIVRAKGDYAERAVAITEEVVANMPPSVDVLAVERMFKVRNIKTLTQLSECVGMTIYSCCHASLSQPQVVRPTPMQSKKALTGDGKAPAEKVIEMAMRISRITDEISLDEAMAIGMAFYAAQETTTRRLR